jgi:hypothetical protein
VLVTGRVAQIGRKNMLILNVMKESNRFTRSLEYADVPELWVKLNVVTESIVSAGTSYDDSGSGRSAFYWKTYGEGVNRAEAEAFTEVLITDTLSIPSKEYTITRLTDATQEMEAGEKMSYSNQWFYFDWSQRGGRTRLDITSPELGSQDGVARRNDKEKKQYSIEFGSTQEFLTKMRGLSVFILETMARSLKLMGFDNYDLSTAVAPASVPANFTKFTRVVTQGGVPSGGFYIANAPITQREYAAVMKQNPSLVKNPAQPVSNVSIVDAMVFCNQMSIRDGLEPAYIIERRIQEGRETSMRSISTDNFASGYRLATTAEWKYANDKMENMGVQYEYVYDGVFFNIDGKEAGVTATGNQSVARATLISHNRDSAIPILEGSYEYNKVDRSANWVVLDAESYEQDLGTVELELYNGKRTARKVRVSPVIRVVRPIFDYWKYTSGQ